MTSHVKIFACLSVFVCVDRVSLSISFYTQSFFRKENKKKQTGQEVIWRAGVSRTFSLEKMRDDKTATSLKRQSPEARGFTW